jgi:hypothetical protein
LAVLEQYYFNLKHHVEACNVQQKDFTVKEYNNSGNSVVRVQRKFCTDFAVSKGPTKNTV